MNEQQVERLAASPAPRVTREQIDKRIVDITYTVLSGGRITTCQIHLDNGFVRRISTRRSAKTSHTKTHIGSFGR